MLLSPLEEGCEPVFVKFWIPSIQRCFVPSLVEIGPVVLEKKIFLISSMYFHYFLIISPWKKAGPFIWIKSNPLHPRMHCAKFGWNFINVFSLFLNYLHFRKGEAFHLNKLESPSPKDALCQVWLKLAQWLMRRKFLKDEIQEPYHLAPYPMVCKFIFTVQIFNLW